MTNDTDNQPTNWHDLSDRLTPEQVADLGNEFGEIEETMAKITRRHLEKARRYAIQNLYADIPAPDDATDVSPWRQHDAECCSGLVSEGFGLECGGVSRTFDTGWVHEISRIWDCDWAGETLPITVSVAGRQYADGSLVDRYIWIRSNKGLYLEPDEARALAASLIEAADEIDQLD